jgi:hypothetical protein
MIPRQRIEEALKVNDLALIGDISGREVKEMSQELLDLREKEKRYQLSLANIADDNLTLRAQNRLLIENSERLFTFIKREISGKYRCPYCGYGDKAHYVRCEYKLIENAHTALMKQVKPFVGDSDHEKDDRIL